MNELLAKQAHLRQGFSSGALMHYDDETLHLPIPDFFVRRSLEGILIDLSLDQLDSSSTVGSSLMPNVDVKATSIPNFIHNFTFGHLSSSTDQPFSSKFPVINDGFDDLTPDVIIQSTAGSYHVVEFTTFRGREEGARGAASLKIAKYEQACRNRSVGRNVGLYAIAVHRGGVWTNMIMSKEDVDELCYRMRLAEAIEADIQVVCPEYRMADEEATKLEREMMGIVASIGMDWSKTERMFPNFKKAMFDKFRSNPPNQEYVKDILEKVIAKAQADLITSSFIGDGKPLAERLEMNGRECDYAIDALIIELRSRPNLRSTSDNKSTVQIPPWVFYEGPEGKSLMPLKELMPEGDHPMCSIWTKVCTSAIMEVIERMDDDPESELNFAMSGERTRDDERSRYHRVRVDLNQEEAEYAATLGVNGKKYRNLQAVVDSRTRSKLIFSPDHDTTDLEQFLLCQDYSDFEPLEEAYAPLLEDMDLRLDAQMIHQPTYTHYEGENEFLANHKKILQSPLGSWTQMVSLIGAELSASVKQHVKPNSFVVKRLLNSPLYMLIKPTSSKSHIFVSFALDKKYWIRDLNASTIFKHYIDAGSMFITDFVSYKLSKLTNLCKTNSLYEASLTFWMESFGFCSWESGNVSEKPQSPSLREALYMTKLSLLTLLEDKATTEELQTLLRYIVMEGFVSQPELPKPHKMIAKLPTKLRSELQVYLLHRSLLSMRRIARSPFRLMRFEGQINWSGLFNPLSGSEIREIHPLISACYNGYFKNKEEETEPSALSAMYKKIIELEHLKPESDDFLGWGDPEEPAMHEFSRSYLKEAVEHAKQFLERIYGRNVMEQIEQDIIRELSSITLERLATLKATSNFNEDWYVYKDVKDKNYTRDKLIVKMSEFAAEGKSLAIEKFEACMSRIEERGAMHICLFKKQQHGGLREIYVMGAEERIVQSVVEAIARSIGRFFSSDTLCNPANKMKIPESHGLRARRHCKGPVWTTATSDDARKWNQGHFVSKFALMLCEFTSPKWWPIIIRGCSMFTNKHMMMNLEFLRILDCHRELNIEDDFVQTLFEAYHGNVDVPWISPGCTYLKTSTGMMQGILHYTSSLLHTIHQEFIRSLTFKIFNMKVNPDMSKQIVCDMMQGSDDSSMLISFPSGSDEILTKCKVTAAICFRVKKLLGVYLAIYPSEKSTACTDFVMEYNSEFFFHSQHVRPTIRWIAASCSLPEVETLVARQEEAANLMTSVSEGGGSFSLAACIQHSQCTLHYMLMGMGTSVLFAEYKKAIKKWKDPGLGFFLMDNPIAAGLAGFRYNLFKAITTTNLQKIYAFFMKKVKGTSAYHMQEGVIPETCSVSPGGALILSSSLKWGSRKKFQKLRSRLNIPDDWVEQINDMPQVLYRAPRTGLEITLRIAEKVHSPGVVSSLSTGNAVAKVMAAAVYFLSATIFEDSGRPEFNFLEDSKYSLLSKLAAYDGFNGVDDIEPEDVLFLFPNVEEFHQLDTLIYNKGALDVTHRSSAREATQTRVVVFDHLQTSRCSPEKLVSDKWFGTQKCKIGRTAMEQEWTKLKSTIRWLRDTPSETLDATPLHSHIQVRNFFARMEGKARTVRVTGAPVKKRSGVSKLAMVIRDNFCKTAILNGIEDEVGLTRSVSAELSKHSLFSVLNGPYTEGAKISMVEKLLLALPEVGINPPDRRSRTNMIGVLQHYAREGEGTIKLLEEIGAGTIGAYVMPQKSMKKDGKVFYYGPGVWRGTMDGISVQIEVDGQPGLPPQMTRILVSRTREPWILSHSIRAWADDMGVLNTKDMKETVRGDVRHWMYNFKLFGSGHAYGCPLIVVPDELIDFRNINDNDIFLKVRGSVINLFTRAKGIGRDLHIMSYSTSENDISSSSILSLVNAQLDSCVSDFTVQPSSSWVKCEPLPLEMIRPVLEIAEGLRPIRRIDSDRLREIIRICTEAALRSKVGTIFTFVPISMEMAAPVDMSAMIDLMLEDDDFTSFQEVVEEVMEDMDIMNSYEVDDFSSVDVHLFGPAHFKEMSNLAAISHPLMDKLIDAAISQMSKTGVRRLVETGKVGHKDLDISKLIFRALGRDPASIITDDFNLDLEYEVTDDMLG
ncbi:polymerase [Salehabad virus]|uniref:RNA-directed RNA polymerase L n=2 Tax=Salehabad virus TaxID=904699 RepID=L0GCI2_9VIRU|nr:polymerase [Salehabad virus]AGA82741.1 polymerase [Salehabad virus]